MSRRSDLTSRPTWGSLFGVVPDRGMRRRPSEIARLVLGAGLVVLGAVRARDLGRLDVLVHDVVLALPGAVLETLRFVNGAGSLVALLVVLGAALLARRIRFIGGVVVAAALAGVATRALQTVVDAPAALAGASQASPPFPDYPSLRLAVVAAVFFVAAPELTRPARRLQWALLVVVAASAVAVTDGYPAGVAGSVALGWAVAAAVHLALGSPDGVPDPDAVRADAADLGVVVGALTPSPVQQWGEAAFDTADDDGPLRVAVIGRDATDAQFLSKLFRFVWYKDSGPDLALSRPQQIQRRAYLLLLAERAGIDTPVVVASGAGGARGDALLVVRTRPGGTLADQPPERLADDRTLDAAWALLADLHRLGLAHGGIAPDAIRCGPGGELGFVDLATADAAPAPSAQLADRAALLVTLSALADEDRAVESGVRALGADGLGEVLTVLQGAALPRALRHQVHDVRHLTARLREAVTARTGVPAPELVELHRVSIANILMAAGAALGVYLLIGQLAQVDFALLVQDAMWIWLPVVVVFSQLPQVGGAVAMLGSVSSPLPLKPVVGVQFANNFTGLVGGTVATLALVVRFFQRQGLAPAVAVSSGVINTIGAMICQVVLVTLGLVITWGSFDLQRSGGSGGGGSRTFLVIVIVVAVVSGVVLLLPRARRRLGALVRPQLEAAWTNLRQVTRTPKKGLQLFGGNTLAQLFFALTLWAALSMYGYPLGIMQLIVINSFASLLGGIAPVPGGMGVIEAGLIAGFTAAGVPQTQAIAATFTARLFTAYLPPIWGWFALAWLRRRAYV